MEQNANDTHDPFGRVAKALLELFHRGVAVAKKYYGVSPYTPYYQLSDLDSDDLI